MRFWHVVAVAAVFALCCLSPLPSLRAGAGMVALALLVLWAAAVQYPVLARFRSAPDWSYGVYLYAFPIQQTLMAFWPGLHPAVHCTAALLLALIPAALSWRFIERPALALKHARWTRSRRAVAAPALEASA